MRASVILGLVLIAAAASVAVVWESGPAGATYPAASGEIAFDSGWDGDRAVVQCPPDRECVELVGRCQIVASTEDLDAATLRDRFEPNYNSAWLLDAASGTWRGDSPAAAPALQGPNDLPGVARLESFFVCMPEGGGTFERAII